MSKLVAFKQLPYSEKLKISMNIINNLKDAGNVQARQIFDYVNELLEVPEVILDSIYSDFEISVENIKKERLGEDMYRFAKSREYIYKLRQEEMMEKKDEDIDNLLEQI